MPLIGFTKLLNKLLDGSKTQTIRKERKHPIKVGDKLYIYWKLRTKECRKLGEAKVTKIQHKFVGEMTNRDAVLDGFNNRKELVKALYEMHSEAQCRGGLFDIITWNWTLKLREATP